MLLHLEAITTEKEIAGEDKAGIVGGEGAVELDGIACEFSRGFDGEAVRVGDFEAEFSGIALRQERESDEEEGELEK